MNIKKVLEKYVKHYLTKKEYKQDLREQILNESSLSNKEEIMDMLDKNLDLFDDYGDVNWKDFPINSYYDNLFGEEL